MHIARALVEQHLAAGVNVLPGLHSVYRWQGQVCEAEEWLVLAQVSRVAFDALCTTIRALHSYETPCIIALPIEAGHSPFLRWIEKNSLSPSTGGA